MTAKEERDARLAAQLRANLKRRKEHARDVPPLPEPPPADPDLTR